MGNKGFNIVIADGADSPHKKNPLSKPDVQRDAGEGLFLSIK